LNLKYEECQARQFRQFEYPENFLKNRQEILLTVFFLNKEENNFLKELSQDERARKQYYHRKVSGMYLKKTF